MTINIITFLAIALVIFFILYTRAKELKQRESKRVKEEKELKDAKELRISKYVDEYKKILSEKPTRLNNMTELDNWIQRKVSYGRVDFFLEVNYNNNKRLSKSDLIKIEKGIAVKRVEDELEKLKPKPKVLTNLEKRGIIFRPYSNFDDIVYKINGQKYSFSESVKDWRSTMLQLTKAVKTFKSIKSRYWSNKNRYHIHYKSILTYSANTLKFEYEQKTFTIIIKTGLAIINKQGEVINDTLQLEYLEKQYEKLLNKMEVELPKHRFELILKEIIEIAKN